MDLVPPVFYLEDNDFSSDGSLSSSNLPENMPVIIFIQASYCGHCNNAKPAFQAFAEKNKGKVLCATIQGDSQNISEQKLMNRIKLISPDFRGFPDYVLYINRKRQNKQIKSRDEKGLQELIS